MRELSFKDLSTEQKVSFKISGSGWVEATVLALSYHQTPNYVTFDNDIIFDFDARGTNFGWTNFPDGAPAIVVPGWTSHTAVLKELGDTEDVTEWVRTLI